MYLQMSKRVNFDMIMRDFTFQEEPFIPAEQDSWPRLDYLLVEHEVSAVI